MLLDAAVALTDAGCCVIPVRPDGSKAPAVRWEQYQIDLPDRDQLTGWFGSGRFDGLGVVCGAVSGGLEMLELEGRAVHLAPTFAQHLDELTGELGADDLWARLCAGYLERSPSGGFHLLYRVRDSDTSAARRNTKLARRPSTPDELAAWKADQQRQVNAEPEPLTRQKRQQALDHVTEGWQVPQVLIETRGEGGFVVTAPSAGRTHDSGQAWTLLAGGPATIPTVTVDERDLLYAAAVQLDQMPTVTVEETRPQVTGQTGNEGLRPGDDWNTRASWDDILGPHGWRRTRKNFAGKGAAWTRPGKQHGVSATTGTAADGVDRLYVFSTSTTFETEKPYSKFAAYAHLEHGGDLSKAAAQLRADGYGAPLEQPRDASAGARPALGWIGPPTAPTGSTPPPGSPPADAPDRSASPPTGPGPGPSTYTLTDDGNALRLVDRHAENVRYCPQRGQWLRWSGHRWVWDEAEQIRELARGIARDIARDLPTKPKPLAVHRAKSLSANGIGNMVRLARTDPRVVVHLTDLDAHPYQLNTPGGVVDLRTGQLHPPDPASLHTRSTTVTPDPTLDAPRWQRFLADTFAGDPELTTYVQRLLGVSLIGEVLEQLLPFPYGAGANGKTTLLNAVQRIIGIGDTGYAISAPAEILLATRNTDHPATKAQLSGARLAVTSELEEGQRFAEAKVKQLTGSDPINARFMARNPFTFVPTHTLWLLANHQPNVRAGGPAFWRRIALLPFVHTVPEDQRDTHLEDTLLRNEAPAILAWLIDGARDYLQPSPHGGLVVPDSVRAATAAYKLDQDTVTRFVLDMCDTGPHTDPLLRTKVADIRSEYEAWCHFEGETTVSPKALTQALQKDFGVYSERSNSTRWYAGIRLVNTTQASGQLSLDPSLDPSPDSAVSAVPVDEPVDEPVDNEPREWWQR